MQGTSTDTEATMTQIETVSIKPRIPPFWRDQPRLWFAQFETTIAASKLSSENKFSLVVAQLEKTDVEQISDIIMSTQSGKRYEDLKQRLLSVYEESDSVQLHKLLNDMDLGDQRPTQLLRRMRVLARDRISDATLQILWMRNLPPATRAVVAVKEDSSLESLAVMADKIHEQAREIDSICACQQEKHTTPVQSHDTESNLHQLVEALTQEVAAIRMERNNTRTRPPFRHNRTFDSRAHGHRWTGSYNDTNKQADMCYFHAKFGSKARKCQPPCKMNRNQGN